MLLSILVRLDLVTRFIQGCHVSGKVREKQKFLQVRELSGNFGHLTNVREMTLKFSKNN